MKYIKKIYEAEVPLEDHKVIISEIKEFDFILKDEGCMIGYYNPGWSLNGFWIKVITNEKLANYREGYTLGDMGRDFKNLYLPYMDEWVNRVEEIFDSSKYAFDFSYDLRNRPSTDVVNKYWCYYFKIWVPRGPKETPSNLYGKTWPS